MNSFTSNSNEYVVTPSMNNRKRVCLALDLKNEKELIEKYKHYHKSENNWSEINDGIRKSGILMMDIFLIENRLFMICEIDANDNFDDCWNKISAYPRQDEWFELMCNFIQALPDNKLEWLKMERVFTLPRKNE